MILRAAFAVSLFLSSCLHRDIPGDSIVGEGAEDFSLLVQRRTTRMDAELTAALGHDYRGREPREVETVRSSLSRHGEFRGYPSHRFGNSVFRVSKREQAARLLENTWPAERLSTGSKLARLFEQYPNATVAMMDADDQQVLFFDERDSLVVVYPPGSVAP